jgi:hypothetical protein
MNQILDGAPLTYFNSELTKSDFTEKDNSNVKKNLNQIENGLIPNIMNGFTDILDNFQGPKNFESSDILAIRGNYEKTPFTIAYFSNSNINSIQQSIRYYVNQQTQQIVDQQSKDEIYIVMRSILFQNGDQTMTGDNILPEIERLNNLTIQFCVEKIVAELTLYNKYTDELQSLRIPISRPSYQDGSIHQLGHPYV